MSYRTFKKLLGENSLERKCRILFGGALMLLITGSFYFYAQLNLRIVRSQYRDRAQLLISQNFITKHVLEIVGRDDPEAIGLLKELSEDLKPDHLREFSWKFIPVDFENADPSGKTSDLFEIDAVNDLLFKNKEYVIHEDANEDGLENEGGKYHYFQKIIAQESCLTCHRDSGHPPLVSDVGDVMAVARLTFKLQDTERDIARNNAVLIAMAIVTAFLAMLAAYAIVRYVIVKPVIHLKDVSDAIAHGDLDQRADIHTGDEFQELSHAFNRMLRHLVTTQDELRDANSNLDVKVDELARANLSLHEMNKIKNEFLATMSHELRTPLNSILGFSDILTSAENLNEKQQKFVANIQSSGQNLLSLIDDILDLAKIEAGRMELHVVEFSVTDLMERAVSSMRPLTERKNIDMQSFVDPELPIVIQDAGKIQQILYNLLSNAVKFTPVGGRIRVSAACSEENEDLFDLIVADSGIGISLEDQSVIFEKFRQGKNLQGPDALTREYEGTGLGLSIVKELSKLLGGEVQLESEFGKGSTFTIRLPVALVCVNRLGESEPRRVATTDLLRQASTIGVPQHDAE